MSTHKTLRGAEGPKTGMFAIFGQVLKDPKTGILTMVENYMEEKSKSGLLQRVEYFLCKKKFSSFVKRLTLYLICYRLQLSCLDQIEKDFRIITLHFLCGFGQFQKERETERQIQICRTLYKV